MKGKINFNVKVNVKVLLIVLLVASLVAGCANNRAATTTTAESAEDRKFLVGFAQVGSETEWRIAMSKEVQDTFSVSDRFELIFSDAQQKQENQIAAMRSFIQRKVDAILFSPIVATGWDAVLTEAKDAGIPVLCVNRRFELTVGNVEDYTLCYIGPDNIYAGELCAQTMIDQFKDDAGPINVVLLEGTVGSSASIDRATGIENVLSKQDKLQVYTAQSGDFNRSKAKEVMESIIKMAQADGTRIDAVIGHADDMNIGASQALEEAGLKPGTDVKLVGVDGVKVAFEAMAEGRYNATVENPLGYGDVTIKILTDYFDNGTKPETWVKLYNTVYTQDQAAELLPSRTF